MNESFDDIAIEVETAEDASESEVARARGRKVPVHLDEVEEPDGIGTIVHIIVKGHKIATVRGRDMTFESYTAMEKCRKAIDFLAWLEKYTGANRNEIETLLNPLGAEAVFDFILAVDAAVKKAIQVPKPKKSS